MKKIFFSSVLLGLALAACQKNEAVGFDQPSDAEQVELTVGVQGASLVTRATNVIKGANGEGKVNTLEVFVFDKANNQLDAYSSVSGQTELTLTCTAGERVIYAVVNAEDDLTEVATLDQLLAKVSDLKDNELTGFEMIGKVVKTLPQEDVVVIDVSRFAARVVISEVVRDFASTSLQAVDFSVDAIYLTNVATQMNYGQTMDNTVWYNQFTVSGDLLSPFVSEFASLTFDTVSDGTLSDSESYSEEHCFYAYPNPHYEGELLDGEEANAETRLVVETTLDGVKRYYPIALPALESNHSYEIRKLTITRPGSLSPDQKISVSDAQFELNVVDWTTVLVSATNDGIIEI